MGCRSESYQGRGLSRLPIKRPNARTARTARISARRVEKSRCEQPCDARATMPHSRLLLVCAAALAIVDDDGVRVLTESGFDSYVAENHDRGVLVKFYAPWCQRAARGKRAAAQTGRGDAAGTSRMRPPRPRRGRTSRGGERADRRETRRRRQALQRARAGVRRGGAALGGRDRVREDRRDGRAGGRQGARRRALSRAQVLPPGTSDRRVDGRARRRRLGGDRAAFGPRPLRAIDERFRRGPAREPTARVGLTSNAAKISTGLFRNARSELKAP